MASGYNHALDMLYGHVALRYLGWTGHQVILLPLPPEWQEMQALFTMPS